MFIVGRTEEGSSNVPTRTAVTSGLADEFAKRGHPHVGQKRCCILLPLSAVLANSLNSPEISIAAVGASKFTIPLADMCWQSRHQQTLTARGSAESLRQDVGDLGQELDAIDGHFQYLRKIVQTQQSFARGSEGEEAVSIGELVETALELKGPELNGAQITRDIPDLPAVWTNRYKLLRIIVNFMGNASDAITANEPERRQIAVRARLTGGWLEITVEDSGVGMPGDLLELVSESGSTTQAPGRGSGLHSAAMAARQLGGSLAASSPGEGQGACFSVKIPARTAVVPPSAEHKAC